jgi:uncharacterized protein (DUF4415 family)
MPTEDPKDPFAAYEDKPVDDPDNPEWTEEDFARAKPMSDEMLDFFPKMRGRPRKPPEEKKVQISIKLHPRVLDHYKAMGPGWQTRMEKVLIDAMDEDLEPLHAAVPAQEKVEPAERVVSGRNLTELVEKSQESHRLSGAGSRYELVETDDGVKVLRRKPAKRVSLATLKRKKSAQAGGLVVSGRAAKKKVAAMKGCSPTPRKPRGSSGRWKA